jgi:hypothetical protein
MRRLRLPALVLCWIVAGCGPSFEAIQEGDLRFAHCDRLDLDPNISSSHRLHCWREWRRVYTYGQTRDRVEYAQRRIAEVVSGDADSPFELPSGQGLRPAAAGPAEPSPLHSPPPAVVPLADDTATAASGELEPPASGGKPEAPGATCLSRCEAARTACEPGCATQPRGCADCESSFQACVGDCKSTEK